MKQIFFENIYFFIQKSNFYEKKFIIRLEIRTYRENPFIFIFPEIYLQRLYFWFRNWSEREKELYLESNQKSLESIYIYFLCFFSLNSSFVANLWERKIFTFFVFPSLSLLIWFFIRLYESNWNELHLKCVQKLKKIEIHFRFQWISNEVIGF